ncbi:MAG: glutaredoxin domain-containing protein [Anaerolineales bacterium]|nr:glutaredoxin domain-containing protein [Anaerolineales bacterium]
MPDKLIVYGADWCLAARRAARFLDRNDVDYEWINIDESEQADVRVREINDGYRSVPTLVFRDGSTLTEPSLDELADRLDIER